MHLQQILHEVWTFLHKNYSDDLESRSYGQLVTGGFLMTTHPLMHLASYRVLGGNIKSSRWHSPLQTRFGALWLLAFPQTKITFEREEISDHQWVSGKLDRAADGDWENCVRSQGAYFEGDWGIIILCAMFLVSGTFNKCLCFSYYMAEYFWDRPCISYFKHIVRYVTRSACQNLNLLLLVWQEK